MFASNDRRTTGSVTLAACLALAMPARAQPISPVPNVEPPRLVADPGVVYPERARQEHVPKRWPSCCCSTSTRPAS